MRNKAGDKTYVVQTGLKVVERCILMTTDPGDLVLDPTCGSGTTATVAEQWGRCWITMDTSRVALALARARLMGARYPYYLLRDTPEGQAKEAALTGAAPPDAHSRPTRGDLREGFVYERAPHVTLKSIANNAEIDTIWEDSQTRLEPLRDALNARLGRTGERASPSDAGLDGPWEEWEIPRHPGDPWPEDAAKAHAILADPAKKAPARTKAMATLRKALADWDAARADTDLLAVRNGPPARDLDDLPEHPLDPWNDAEAERLHAEWWAERIARQTAIDASIAQKADVELLYDRPIPDASRTRVAGPFTVESLSPHRMVPADEDDLLADSTGPGAPVGDFAAMILEQLRAAGVQQSAKEDRITFDALDPWPGDWLGAQGTYTVPRADGTPEARRAGILIGPEFGTLSRTDLTAAAREAVDAGFDLLIACGFAFDAHSSELTKLGPLPILKARMNPDLHMSADLKATGAGNLFVVFGEPDVSWTRDAEGRIAVTVRGVDVFDPKTTEVRASGKDEIAAWFIDTDYDEEAFHVRHAYFTGANDPYKALKTTLRDEIDRDAWETLNRLTSRPFARPETGRFAVKVINHLGDEVMKVFTVDDDG